MHNFQSCLRRSLHEGNLIYLAGKLCLLERSFDLVEVVLELAHIVIRSRSANILVLFVHLGSVVGLLAKW